MKTAVNRLSVNGGFVYTREDYEVFIHHIEGILREADYKEVYNISSFGASIDGVKNVSFDKLNLTGNSNSYPAEQVLPFKIELKSFMQDEFRHINDVISLLSRGVFSTALVSSIVKSVLVYQCMQADILDVLQKNLDSSLAEDFIEKTKVAIKKVVDLLQRSKLI